MVQFLAHGLASGSVYALLTLGFALVYRSTGIFHVCHGAAFASAAYCAYAARALAGLPWLAVILAAVVGAVSVNIVCDRFVYRPLQARGSSPLSLTLGSFGAYLVASNAIAAFAGTDLKVLRRTMDRTVEFAGLVFTRTELIGLFLGGLSVALVIGVINVTEYGLKFRAFAQNDELYSVLGLNPLKPRFYLLLLSSVLAAEAALFVGLDRGLTPTMGLSAVLTAAVCVILGGTSLLGAVLAAFGIGMLQSLVTWGLSAEWQDAVTFGLLIAASVARPKAFSQAKGMS